MVNLLVAIGDICYFRYLIAISHCSAGVISYDLVLLYRYYTVLTCGGSDVLVIQVGLALVRAIDWSGLAFEGCGVLGERALGFGIIIIIC